MPTRWAPRTTQMDVDPFSPPSQENPLKIVLGSRPLATPRSKSTTVLPAMAEIHHNTYSMLVLLDHNRTSPK